VIPWEYPASHDLITPDIVEQVITEIGRGMPDGQRYTNHNRAKARQAWPVVQKYCPDKTENQCRRAVADWIKSGLLYEDKYTNPVQRKEQTGLFALTGSTEDDDDDT
jgi:hypothetical protein